jgi:hypothetical protein
MHVCIMSYKIAAMYAQFWIYQNSWNGEKKITVPSPPNELLLLEGDALGDPTDNESILLVCIKGTVQCSDLGRVIGT